MKHAHSAPQVTKETIWPYLRVEAEALQKAEPALAVLLQNNILSQESFQGAVGRILAGRLASPEVNAATIRDIFMTSCLSSPPTMHDAARNDLFSIVEHDPAAHDIITPFLFFKGFHALQSYRVSHWLWQQGRRHLALHFQNRISDLFGVDIHPAAQIGQGVMMDHATGIVIGETAIVGDDVLFWHGVTLGGKGLSGGDRHPKIGKGVQLGAGSTVLGNIEVAAGARVAAGSVVISDVPPGVTVAGVPAKIIG